MPLIASSTPSSDPFKGRPLGRVLTKMGKVTREQVVEALVYQKQHGGMIGEIINLPTFSPHWRPNVASALEQSAGCRITRHDKALLVKR